MKYFKKQFAAVIAILVLGFSGQVAAGPIIPDAGWYGFCFGSSSGDPATPGCQNEGIGTTGNTFTFTLAGPGILKVTDAFVVADTFDVYINSIFSTDSRN